MYEILLSITPSKGGSSWHCAPEESMFNTVNSQAFMSVVIGLHFCKTESQV